MAELINRAHGSNTLSNEIFKKQPGPTELQRKIESMVAQFSPRSMSPKVQEVLNRIGFIGDTLTHIAGETRAEIVSLYTETVTKAHLTVCSSQIDILNAHQCQRIANILGVPPQKLDKKKSS